MRSRFAGDGSCYRHRSNDRLRDAELCHRSQPDRDADKNPNDWLTSTCSYKSWHYKRADQSHEQY